MQMFQACKKGNLSKLQQMNNYDISTNLSLADKYGMTPLHLSTQYNHLHIIQWLNDHGAAQDVSTKESTFGRTPLFTACQLGFLTIVEWLHKNGAANDITETDNRD